MRNLYDCPFFTRYYENAFIPCNYPLRKKCGFTIYAKNERLYPLCSYRVEELGIDNCIKEIEALEKIETECN